MNDRWSGNSRLQWYMRLWYLRDLQLVLERRKGRNQGGNYRCRNVHVKHRESVSYGTTGIIEEKVITAVIRCAVLATFISPFSSRSGRNGIGESSTSGRRNRMVSYLRSRYMTERRRTVWCTRRICVKEEHTRTHTTTCKSLRLPSRHVGNHEFNALTFMLIARLQMLRRILTLYRLHRCQRPFLHISCCALCTKRPTDEMLLPSRRVCFRKYGTIWNSSPHLCTRNQAKARTRLGLGSWGLRIED